MSSQAFLCRQVLATIKQFSIDYPDTYVNPNLLTDITVSIYDYSDIEDDDVKKYIQDMFGA